MVEIHHLGPSPLSSRPHTPPYTPLQATKRAMSRNASPTSRASSIHPAETSSPARKIVEVFSTDNIEVVELDDNDLRSISDAEIVHPDDSEDPTEDDNSGDDEDEDEDEDEDDEDDDEDDDSDEADDDDDSDEADDDDDDDDESTASDASSSTYADQLARQLSGLRCSEQDLLRFHQLRQQRRHDRRRDSQLGKRSHSKSAQSESGHVDADALDDHDCLVAQRRLRRRTRGPGDLDFDYEQLKKSAAAVFVQQQQQQQQQQQRQHYHHHHHHTHANMRFAATRSPVAMAPSS